MKTTMHWKKSLNLLAAIAGASLLSLACGGGGSSSSGQTTRTGTVHLTISDAASDDWSIIGVKVLDVSLVPKGGGTPVSVFSASSAAPWVNLVQLDQLSEILGNVEVPVGTYARALVTISANPADIQLTSSSDPEAGFPLAGETSVPTDQIKVRRATGAAGSQTTQVAVKLEEDLVVGAGGSNALDLEFDLRHPALIVQHQPPGGSPVWTVNFEGPLRHRRVRHLAELVLRHQYGQVEKVDSASFTMTKVHPARPVTDPETAVATDRSLTVKVDAANGTIVHDLDARTRTVMKDFSALAAAGKYVRVAARYQDDGSLFAVRVWVSASFQKVWLSPEGHVLHVNTTTDRIWVENEGGAPVPVTVDDQTQFFFRTPKSALSDSTPIGTGKAFLANLHRGFKVHLSVVDPLATPLVADSIDIEVARFDGTLTLMAPAGTGLTYTRHFITPVDDYVQDLPYISATSPNGQGNDGSPLLGFKWWDFTFPTLADTGASAIPDLEAAVGGSVDFGGSVGTLKVWGESYARWGDPSNATGWAASFAILVPTPAPMAKVATPWMDGVGGGTFGMAAAAGGGNTVTASLSTVPGSATLVYEVDRSGGVVTVTPIDISTADGLAALKSQLATGTLVKAFGVPQPGGALGTYVLFFYTGSTMPSVTM